ncbi:MAG: hypothetical protein CL398_02980 [Acidiferrobacteraceae bacterium]|nr:hypothetical protein [Acidiferrobacteraceae bacterium]
MKIAVVGVGGVGGYLGGKLAANGSDVVFLVKSSYLDIFRRKGLHIVGAENVTVFPVHVSDEARDVGVVDIVLLCVKLYDLQAVSMAILPLIGQKTSVVTLQNGVESPSIVGAIVGHEKIIPGAAYFPANINTPGEIEFKGAIQGKPLVEFALLSPLCNSSAISLLDEFRDAGVSAQLSLDADRMLWEKFCWILGVSSVTAATRQDISVVRSDNDMRALFAASVHECAEVGRASGVDLANSIELDLMNLLDANPGNGKSSLLVDLEKSRPLELEGLAGVVHRLGLKHRIPTPVTSTVYASLKAFVSGNVALG